MTAGERAEAPGGVAVADPARWVAHRHTAWPSLSAGPAVLVARLGDWTWEQVAQTYAVDVLAARTADHAPAYLSFHYCRYRATPIFHLGSPGFGDCLDVASLVLAAGPQSTLTLHCVTRDGPPSHMSANDFFAAVPAGELRVEHLNRWITPGPTSNTQLTATTPVGFNPAGARPVDAPWPGRRRIRRARALTTFRHDAAVPAGEPCELGYTVDVARDLNAVGLLYFATYHGVVDWAVWRAWSCWGRRNSDFLSRCVVDQELLYLGNADAGSELAVVVGSWRLGAQEGADVVIRRASDLVPICVSTLTFGSREDR